MVSPTFSDTQVVTSWTRTVVSASATRSWVSVPHRQGIRRIALFSSLRPLASRRCFALPISDAITALEPSRGGVTRLHDRHIALQRVADLFPNGCPYWSIA